MKAVCGLDVHKDSIFLCILHSDGELFEQVFVVLTFQLEGYPMRGKSFSFYRGKIQNYSKTIHQELTTFSKNWQSVPEDFADIHRLYPSSSYSAKWHRISSRQHSATCRIPYKA